MPINRDENKLPEPIIIEFAQLSDKDRKFIKQCRGEHNRLGICYQLIYVKVLQYFPSQQPLDIHDQLLAFTSLQINIPSAQIKLYQRRQQTISAHQLKIGSYLKLKHFNKASARKAVFFVTQEAKKTDLMDILLTKLETFLREQRILLPPQDTLKRLTVRLRQRTREYIFNKLSKMLTPQQKKKLRSVYESHCRIKANYARSLYCLTYLWPRSAMASSCTSVHHSRWTVQG